MPHLVIEYTANLEADGDLQGLCNKAAAVLVSQQSDGKPVYPIGGVRVRAHRIDTWCMADGQADYAFVHANLKIGSGRPDAVKQATGDAVFNTIQSHFAGIYASRYLALSMEINEFSEAGTWKHNNVHARFKRP